MFGVIAIAMVIEATRRTMGIFLPLLAVATVLYGIFGPWLPGGLCCDGVFMRRGYPIGGARVPAQRRGGAARSAAATAKRPALRHESPTGRWQDVLQNRMQPSRGLRQPSFLGDR